MIIKLTTRFVSDGLIVVIVPDGFTVVVVFDGFLDGLLIVLKHVLIGEIMPNIVLRAISI